MDWSVKSMLQESLRSLIKSEIDLGIDLAAAKVNVQRALIELDGHPRKCTRCWGRGVIKCVLCGAEGEIDVPVRRFALIICFS